MYILPDVTFWKRRWAVLPSHKTHVIDFSCVEINPSAVIYPGDLSQVCLLDLADLPEAGSSVQKWGFSEEGPSQASFWFCSFTVAVHSRVLRMFLCEYSLHFLCLRFNSITQLRS